jgi:hypothetical protein
VYEGTASAPDRDGKIRELSKGELAVMQGNGAVTLASDSPGAKLLFADGEPIREPVARYGPFVMNTREELVKAFDDYSRGELDQVAT